MSRRRSDGDALALLALGVWMVFLFVSAPILRTRARRTRTRKVGSLVVRDKRRVRHDPYDLTFTEKN